MSTIVRWLLTLIVLASLAPAASADDRDDMLSRIPDTANSVAVINAGALYSSPRGKREAWSTQQQLLNSVPVPSFVDVIVTSSHWKPASTERQWLIAQATLTRPVMMESFAKLNKSSVESLGGMNVVLTRNRGYFVELDAKTVAAVNPPDRREVTRWIRSIKQNSKPEVSAYLSQAVRTSGSAHVVAALDLQDMMDPKALREWVAHTQTLGKKPAEMEPILKLLSNLHGVRLVVRVEERGIPAELHCDFNEAPGAASSWVKPLFQELIEEMGMGLEEFQKATARVEGKAVVLRTNLTDAGLARILTTILGPTIDSSHGQESTSTDASAGVNTTKRYYQTIQKYAADLKDITRRSSNYNTAAVWYDNYAKQIDQLSLVNVDPEMAKYGAEVSRKFRLLGSSLRGVPLQVRALEGQKQWALQYNAPVYNYGWGHGPWGARPGMYGYQPGNFRYDDNFAQVRAQQQESILKDAKNRDMVWQELDDERNQIRSKMTQKYMVDFDAGEK